METTNEVSVVNLSGNSVSPSFPSVVRNKAGGWLSYGKRNDFPQEIMALNMRSPINSAIIASTVTYICGKGVKNTPENADRYVGRPNPNESWDDLIKPLATDLKTFGGFYIQVIPNKKSTTVSLFHQDFTEVRIGEVSATGEPLSYRIAADWKKTSGAYTPLNLKAWPGISKSRKGEAYIFAYKGYTPGLKHYCLPEYFPGIEYIKADGSLGEFYNNSIDNGFTPSAVITMPSNPDQAKKDEFQSKMEGAFSGAKGASSVIILWGENTATKPTIEAFSASANADIYNEVEAIVFQKIISAHRLASPTLAGVSGSGNLSGNATEIIDAYVLYNYTVIADLRKRLLDSLNVFTKINGTAELVIADLDVVAQSTKADGTAAPATLKKQSTFKKLINYLNIWR